MTALHDPDLQAATRVSLTLTVEVPRGALDVLVRLRSLVEQLDRADLLLLNEVAADLAVSRQRSRKADSATRERRERPTPRPATTAEVLAEVTGGRRP